MKLYKESRKTMISIEVVESEFHPVTFVVSESGADALAESVGRQCQDLYDKREKLVSSGDWFEPYSELEKGRLMRFLMF